MKSIKTQFYLLAIVSFLNGSIFAQNPSDGCTGVPVLPVDTYCTPITYSLSGAYANGGLVNASCMGGLDRDDGWYAFVATNTTTDVWLTGNRTHTVSAWTSCGGGTELACDSDNAGQTSTISFATVIGVTYYIQVQRNQSNNASTMTGDICIHDPHPANQNCSTSVPVCADAGFPGNSSGFDTQDLDATNNGCLVAEHQSSWYSISFATGGNFQFTISPRATDDYDFAVYGPGAACPPTSDPIRCSAGSGPGDTGVNSGLNTDGPQTSEGPTGDLFVDDIVVSAGETYMILIDNFSASLSTFDLIFGGSAGLTCVPLPVDFIGLDGEILPEANILTWSTKSELNNSFFTIEKSRDGENWDIIAYEDGANNSTEQIDYSFRDRSPSNELNYYRLSQTDYDGTKVELGVIALDNANPSKKLLRIVNLMGEIVGPEYKGIKVYVYSDGTVIKQVSQ